MDATNPMVFVRAQDLGLSGTERAEALDADLALAARLEAIRVAAAGERLWREVRLYRIAPVSQQMVLNYLSEHVLGLPKSY